MIRNIVLLLHIFYCSCSQIDISEVNFTLGTNCTDLTPTEFIKADHSRLWTDYTNRLAPKSANCLLTATIFSVYEPCVQLILQQSVITPARKLPIITYEENGEKRVNEIRKTFAHYQGFSHSKDDDYVVLKAEYCQDTKTAWIEGVAVFHEMVLELRKTQLQSSDRNITLNASRIYVDKTNPKVATFDTGRSSEESQRRFLRSIDLADTQRYIELHIIHDFGMFKALGRNIQNNIERSIDIVNVLDTVYRTVNTRVFLASVEVWNIDNKIELSTNDQRVLTSLMAYAEPLLKMPTIDNVQLLTTTKFENFTVGLAYVMGMCTPRHSGGIIYDNTQIHYINAARTMVHELGHNLGMHHDDKVDCRCPSGYKTCFMASRESYPISRFFSDCSVNEYSDFIERGLDSCLHDSPEKLLNRESICGNNVVDIGEDCDCGHPYFCTSTCCNAWTCKLQINAECDTGLCCHQCHFKPQFTICRQPVDMCDIPEYCSGTSGYCPRDEYRPNGEACDVKQIHFGLCHNGKCISRDIQCKRLWGSPAQDGGAKCHLKLNSLGTAYGHCGFENASAGTYKACEESDAFCGLLQCGNSTNNMPVAGFEKSRTIVFVPDGNKLTKCYSCSAKVGDDPKDLGMVADRTPCADGKFCINARCVEQPIWKPCGIDCGEQGQCTDSGKCACSAGWEGPRCSDKTTIIVASRLYILYHNTTSVATVLNTKPSRYYVHVLAIMILLHALINSSTI